MYNIIKKSFGIEIVLEGFIKKNELEKMLEDSKRLIPSLPETFGVMVDMRSLFPLPRDAQVTLEAGEKLLKDNGMVRSVVILDKATLTLQFKHTAKKSGIDKWERYINSAEVTDWRPIGEKWLIQGIDPNN